MKSTASPIKRESINAPLSPLRSNYYSTSGTPPSSNRVVPSTQVADALLPVSGLARSIPLRGFDEDFNAISRMWMEPKHPDVFRMEAILKRDRNEAAKLPMYQQTKNVYDIDLDIAATDEESSVTVRTKAIDENLVPVASTIVPFYPLPIFHSDGKKGQHPKKAKGKRAATLLSAVSLTPNPRWVQEHPMSTSSTHGYRPWSKLATLYGDRDRISSSTGAADKASSSVASAIARKKAVAHAVELGLLPAEAVEAAEAEAAEAAAAEAVELEWAVDMDINIVSGGYDDDERSAVTEEALTGQDWRVRRKQAEKLRNQRRGPAGRVHVRLEATENAAVFEKERSREQAYKSVSRWVRKRGVYGQSVAGTEGGLYRTIVGSRVNTEVKDEDDEEQEGRVKDKDEAGVLSGDDVDSGDEGSTGMGGEESAVLRGRRQNVAGRGVAKGGYCEYPSTQVLWPSAEEYEQCLQDPQWTCRQTLRLLELCEEFDRRFIVIHDRIMQQAEDDAAQVAVQMKEADAAAKDASMTLEAEEELDGAEDLSGAVASSQQHRANLATAASLGGAIVAPKARKSVALSTTTHASTNVSSSVSSSSSADGAVSPQNYFPSSPSPSSFSSSFAISLSSSSITTNVSPAAFSAAAHISREMAGRAVLATDASLVPLAQKTVEDLKDRFYTVQKKLLMLRNGSDPHVMTSPMFAAHFSKDYERERKALLLQLFRRKATDVVEVAKNVLENHELSKVIHKTKSFLREKFIAPIVAAEKYAESQSIKEAKEAAVAAAAAQQGGVGSNASAQGSSSSSSPSSSGGSMTLKTSGGGGGGGSSYPQGGTNAGSIYAQAVKKEASGEKGKRSTSGSMSAGPGGVGKGAAADGSSFTSSLSFSSSSAAAAKSMPPPAPVEVAKAPEKEEEPDWSLVYVPGTVDPSDGETMAPMPPDVIATREAVIAPIDKPQMLLRSVNCSGSNLNLTARQAKKVEAELLLLGFKKAVKMFPNHCTAGIHNAFDALRMHLVTLANLQKHIASREQTRADLQSTSTTHYASYASFNNKRKAARLATLPSTGGGARATPAQPGAVGASAFAGMGGAADSASGEGEAQAQADSGVSGAGAADPAMASSAAAAAVLTPASPGVGQKRGASATGATASDAEVQSTKRVKRTARDSQR